MKMTFLCEASSRRTGSGEWHQWTASSSEGAWWTQPCFWAASGACLGGDRAFSLSHKIATAAP